MEPTKEKAQGPAPAPMAKYKIKGGKASISYPGFKHEVTKDHIEGPNAEMFIAAFKKLDAKFGVNPDGKPKEGYKGFDHYIEEVKG